MKKQFFLSFRKFFSLLFLVFFIPSCCCYINSEGVFVYNKRTIERLIKKNVLPDATYKDVQVFMDKYQFPHSDADYPSFMNGYFHAHHRYIGIQFYFEHGQLHHYKVFYFMPAI